MEDLRKEKDSVSNQIQMAKNQLKSTEDLLKMLQDSKKVGMCFLESDIPMVLNTHPIMFCKG